MSAKTGHAEWESRHEAEQELGGTAAGFALILAPLGQSLGEESQTNDGALQGRDNPRSMLTQRSPFNLVEITLAMGVVAMGIAGIMALFALGMQQSRDAVGDNYAADSAEQFISFISQQAADGGNWNATGLTFLDPSGSGKPDDPAVTDIPTYTGWTQEPNTNVYSSPVLGLYRVTQGSASGAITDFDAAVRVWQVQIEGVYFSKTKSSMPIPEDYAVALLVEVSWPTAKPYAQREKRLYRVEIFNRNK